MRTFCRSVGVLLLASIALRAQPPAPAVPTGPVQPVPFSHKQHLLLDLECRDCHTNPDVGRLMTYPPTSVCMSCHGTMAVTKPSLQTLTALAASGKPIPWVRVYELPDYVYWSHSAHLKAGVNCTDCHGQVAQRDVVVRETNITTMDGCVNCHDKRQVYTDCGDCHEPRR